MALGCLGDDAVEGSDVGSRTEAAAVVGGVLAGAPGPIGLVEESVDCRCPRVGRGRPDEQPVVCHRHAQLVCRVSDESADHRRRAGGGERDGSEGQRELAQRSPPRR